MGIIGLVGKLMAAGIVAIAVAIAVIPSLLYTALPADISLDLTKPTTLIITGANSGLGLATVQNFAHNENATIIMACRSMSRCLTAKQTIKDNLGKEATKADLRPTILNLSQKSSIEAFVKELQGQPIDVLINNAGLAGATPELSFHPEDGVETHIRVNHLGAFYLTHCLWKNLLKADEARVVMVSSVMAAPTSSIPTFGWYKDEPKFTKAWNVRQYACSKRANLFFANELHYRYKDTTTVSVTAAHPGFTHTRLCKNGCKGNNSAGSVGRYFSNLEAITGIIKMPAEEGSLSQAYAAILPEAGVYVGPSLLMVGEPKILGTLDKSWHHMSFTREESKQLWEKSMQAMGIKVFGEVEIPLQPVEEEPEPEVEEAEVVEEEVMQEEEELQRAPEEMDQREATETNSNDVNEEEEAEAEEVEEEEEEIEEELIDEDEDEDEEDEDSSEDEEEERIWNTYLGDGEYKEAVMM